MKDKRLEMFEEINRIKEKEKINLFLNTDTIQLKNNFQEHDEYYLNTRLNEIRIGIEATKSELIKSKYNINKYNEIKEKKHNEINKINHEVNLINKKLEKTNDIFNKENNDLKELGNLKFMLLEREKILFNLESIISLEKRNQIDLSNRLSYYLSEENKIKYKLKNIESEININKSLKNQEDKKNEYYLNISRKLFLNEISIGNAIKKLRKELLNLSQNEFSQLVNVSRKTISDVENNRGNLSVETLNAIVKPFNFRLTLLPSSSNTLEKLTDKS